MSRSAAILLGRFGFGARLGDRANLTGSERESLYAQIGVPPVSLPALEGLATSEDVARLTSARRSMMAADKDSAKAEFKEQQRAIQRADLLAGLNAPLQSDHGLSERLVRFWTNYFTVSTRKGPVRTLAGAFEREVIRPNIYGRFVDMLQAAERHPAMLLYYDNTGSVGPSSRAGERRGRGLNENMAREVLELHTIGAGYGQEDVTAFAETLTGWSIDLDGTLSGTPGSFHFKRALHEPGARTIMGRLFNARGEAQGTAVLDWLGTDSRTYGRIAERLVRYFFSDSPDQALVSEITAVLTETGGDLATATRTLVESEDALTRPPEKARDPIDYIVGLMRALGAREITERRLVAILDDMGQRPYAPLSPKGWPDTQEAWLSSQGLARRTEVAQALARRFSIGDPIAGLEDLFGPLLSAHTKTVIEAAPSTQLATALALAAPEFQYR